MWQQLIGLLAALLTRWLKRDSEMVKLEKEAENAKDAAQVFAEPDRSESDVLARMRKNQRG